MDARTARAVFDRELRLRAASTRATLVERVGPVIREMSRAEPGWGGIAWSDLDASTADAEIDAQLAYFGSLGRSFEWKLYDGDQPPDLPDRLQAKRFHPEDPEALMIADIDDLDLRQQPPEGVSIVEVHDAAGVGLLNQVAAEVFGHPVEEMGRGILRQLDTDPESLSVVLALAGGVPICSARTEFHPGTPFASFWGGGTLAAWRGRGVYRSVVAHRAREAQARGCRYLRVDASPESEPILVRLGFVRAGTTTPYQSPVAVTGSADGG